jgi:hypothetical protein
MRPSRVLDEKYSLLAIQQLRDWQQTCLPIGVIVFLLALALSWL